MVTIEKYVRQSFAGATEVNLSKLLRLAAQKAVHRVTIAIAYYKYSCHLFISILTLLMIQFLIFRLAYWLVSLLVTKSAPGSRPSTGTDFSQLIY